MKFLVKPLTRKQKLVLNFIKQFWKNQGYSPSLKEIARFLKTTNLSTAQYYVEELTEKGYLKKHPYKNRNLIPLNYDQTVQLLGYIAAGQPIEPIENPETIQLPPNIQLQNQHAYYALKVKGDSMIDMGILDNDIVLIKHQLTAEPGDTVVAITENGATLKIFKRKNKQIVLEPRHSGYPAIFPKQLEIRGKFIGLIRFPD